MGLRDWNFFPFVNHVCIVKHDRSIVDILQTLGASDAAITRCESQGLETCSDLQFVAEHLLLQCGTLVVVWYQMQEKRVTMVVQIVEVMKEFQPEVESRKRTFSIWQPRKRAKQNGLPAILSKDQQRKYTAVCAVVELS